MLQIGSKVETVDTFCGHNSHVNFGVVERMTPTLVIVRNEHGNIQRHYLNRKVGDLLESVGYSFPLAMHALRVL